MTKRAETQSARARRVAGGSLLVVVLVVMLLVSLVPTGEPAGSPERRIGAPDAPPAQPVEGARRRVAAARETPDDGGGGAVADPATDRPLPDGSVRIVVTTDAGEPVSGVFVQLAPERGDVAAARSDASGRLTLRRPEGRVTLRVPLGGDLEQRFLPFAARELAADEWDVPVELIEGAPVRGRVLAPDGSPLRSVYLDGDERPSRRRLPPVLTDEAGRFRALVRPGATLDLELDGVARTTLVRAKSGTEVLQVEVPWWGTWTGLVPGPDEILLRAAELPRRSMDVTVRTPDGAPVGGARVRWSLGRWSPFAPAVAADDSGRVTFEDLPARARIVHVELPDDATAWVAPDPEAVEAGRTEVIVELLPASRITGRVRRADGGAVSWCGVDLLHDGRTIASCTSGGDGAFEVALPEDAPAPLRLEARFYARDGTRLEGAVEDVWPGTTGVEVEVSVPE
jgi:hypothetical protein